MRNNQRITASLFFVLWLSLWLSLSPSTSADQVILKLDAVPDSGLMVANVDLTAAVLRCKLSDVHPGRIQAVDPDGNLVPFQFIPAPDFHAQSNITGIIAARLSSPGKYLTLRFGSNTPSQRDKAPSIKTSFYQVVHDPAKGGLPSKITFASGKVFQDFRWQDRLHHKTLGGFTLQSDQKASLECIGTGPVCTAWQVRARYVNAAGKAPKSNPQATYQWLYFDEIPLVYINAIITQQESFAWNEIHFLELNFPGEDFKEWTGGEPFQKGAFQGTSKSHHVTHWGALVDGSNAIAMLECGQPIFHDGRGGYGTYLHAYGDRAWKTWTDTQAQFSAWLWINSSDNAIDSVRSWVYQLPTSANIIVTTADVKTVIESTENIPKWCGALAKQLEAEGRFDEAKEAAQGHLLPKFTLVEAGDLKLVLENTGQGIRLLSLFDETTNQQLLATNPSALFSATVRNVKTKEQVSIHADSGWRQVKIDQNKEMTRYSLAFYNPLDERLKKIGVEVTLTPNIIDHALHWDLQIHNKNPEWSLWRVVFPQVSIVHMAEGAKVFLPHTAGIESTEFWNTNQRKGGTYPSGWTCMQYMAAYQEADRTGVYIGMHDPFGSTKDIFAQGQSDKHAVSFTFDHPIPDMNKPGNAFDLPGEAVWQLLRGDWFDAAMIYRDWIRREAKWWPALGPEGRSDTPPWMRELSVWALTGGSPSDCVPQVKELINELKLPVGFHWYNWHQIPFDNDYPHYFPPKDGFGQGVAELKKAGVYVMPYINGRLWDTHDKQNQDWQFTSVALAAATKDEDNNPYTESYGSKETDGNSVTLAAMCPTTPLWQKQVQEIVLKLFHEYGLNGVYIDQIAAAQPRLCFDLSHGHPLGGGNWWTQGYWKLLDAIRAVKPADCMLTTECNAEPYIKWFDGYLTWHWQEQNMVPAFSAVYGGAIQMFGRAYRGGPSQDLANRMKAAQQLVFGEQIGWFDPGIIKRPDCGKFLRDCIQLRWQLRRYFYAGRMIRPPVFMDKIPSVTADWQWRGEWPITTKSLMAGGWYLPREKKIILIFANVSDQSISTRVKLHLKEYGIQKSTLTVIVKTPTGISEKLLIPEANQPQINFAPRTIFAWEISLASDTINTSSRTENKNL